MNDEPRPTDFAAFAKPPATSTAVARFLPYAKGIVGGGMLIGFIGMIGTVFLPDGWKPFDILGRAAGGGEKHEILEKAEAKIAFERSLAAAVAQAQAEAQMKMQIAVAQAQAEAQAEAQINVEAARQALAERTQSNALNSVMAGLADAACIGSQVVSSFGAQNTGRTWQGNAQATAGATCGLGNAIREDIVRSQNAAVVAATTARGLPQANPTMPAPQQARLPRAVAASASPEQGGTPTTSPPPRRVKAPAPADWGRAIRSLDDVYAINEPSQHFTPDAIRAVSIHASHLLPRYVYNRCMDGLGTSEHDQDVFMDRARIAIAFVQEHP